MPTLRSRALVPVLAALAALGVAATVHAQAADSFLRGFEPTGEWRLVVQGAEAPKARIFDSARAQALLVLSSEFESPVLIDRAGRTVATLDLMKVAERADGRVDLLADALLQPAGGISLRNRNEAHFRVGDKEALVKPSAWKLGPQRGAALLADDAGYRWRARGFAPDTTALARLRAEGRDVRVLVFFGSWCPHCREHLPLLLKVEEGLAGARLRFDYYGLPSPFGGEPEAAKWNVDSVPTAIVLVDGSEVGRIPAAQWSRPELALAQLLG